MKNIILIIMISALISSIDVYAQSSDNFNAASKLLLSNKGIAIGGYGQIDFNKPFGNNKIENGTLDVHRLVFLFGYRFTNKLSFISEIELEHVSEVYVEQAFLAYDINTYFQLRGGLMLVPMGIINEYHEPTTFNGVERPLIDKYISPSTWREIGIGFSGNIPDISLKYQVYLMNGFNSYDGNARLSGKYGLRKGRQKGIESIFKTPVLASRVEYFGLLGLNIGLSYYLGNTQSTMYNNLNRNDEGAVLSADSSIVKISMIGLDARYERKGFQFRGQGYFTNISNTLEYNIFTQSNGVPNDVGSNMYGYYLEGGYNIFRPIKKLKSEMIIFLRYSEYDTQNKVANGLALGNKYKTKAITTGFGWKPSNEVMLKADVQFIKYQLDTRYNSVFNAGIAIWF